MILRPLSFLTYVKYLSNGLKSELKLFAGDTSLLSIAHDVHTSANDINNDSKLIQAGLGTQAIACAHTTSLAQTIERAMKSPPKYKAVWADIVRVKFSIACAELIVSDN